MIKIKIILIGLIICLLLLGCQQQDSKENIVELSGMKKFSLKRYGQVS